MCLQRFAAMCLFVVIPWSQPLDGVEPTPVVPVTAPPTAETTKDPFHYQTGTVTVGSNLATIELPEGYRYLQAKEARTVVETLWGNPPDEDVLGLVVPAGSSVRTWAIIVAFDATGFVTDDDAKTNNYDDILAGMQEGSRKRNEVRRQKGYPTVDLLGWAEPPHYDSGSRKLYWAKRLQFGGEPEVTLNYDVRILGRTGCLVLSAVANDSQLQTVSAGVQAVLTRTEFSSGNRYADFVSGDKMSPLGIAGLVAGGALLAKAGGLKLLVKLLVVSGVLVLAVIGKIFVSRKNK